MHGVVGGSAQDPGVVFPPKHATLEDCHRVIDAMGIELARLREQMKLLQERLKLDSRSSSKPPSSDGPGGGNRSQRRASAQRRARWPSSAHWAHGFT